MKVPRPNPDPGLSGAEAWRHQSLETILLVSAGVASLWLAIILATTPGLFLSVFGLTDIALTSAVWAIIVFRVPDWIRLLVLEVAFGTAAFMTVSAYGLTPGGPILLGLLVLLSVIYNDLKGGLVAGAVSLAIIGYGAWGWTTGFLPRWTHVAPLDPHRAQLWIRFALAQLMAIGAITGLITYMTRAMRRAIVRHMLAEDRFTRAFRACPDALVITEMSTGRYIEVNDGHERLTGYSREEVVGRTSLEVGAFKTAAEREAFVAPLREHGFVRSAPLLIHHKTGALIHATYSCECFELEGRKVALTILHDISEQKRTEAALKSNEESFRNFVENAGVGVYRSTPEGRIVMANSALLRIMGFDSFEEMAARDLEAEGFGQLYPRKDFRARLERDGYLRGWEAGWTKKDGATVYVRESASVVRDETGRIRFYDGIIEDISERKKAEEALRESEERFRTLTSAAFEGVIISENGVILDINDQGLAMFGFTREEMIGRELVAFTAPHERELMARKILTSSEAIHEHDLLRKGGGTFRAETKAKMTPIGGRTLRMTAVHDITQRRQNDEKRKNLEEQLLQMQKMEALGTLAGGIAHDFNNILTGILGNLEIAELDLPPGHPAFGAVQAANRASRRARELVARILSFSLPKNESRAPAPLGPVILEAVQLLRVGLPSGIEIHTKLDPHCPLIEFDPGQLHQVIMNLGTNSAHALRERGGMISMELRAVAPGSALRERHPQVTAKHVVCFTLRDNGSGMPPAVLKRIFEPFYTTKEFGQGTGLGLAMVHTIMKAHDGAIVVESMPGLGTTFELYFPAAAVKEAEAKPRAKAPKKGMEPFGNDRSILFVDDEDTVLSIGTTLLRRLGFNPVSFAHPAEALAVFQAEPDKFSAVISDLTMPQMTGIELARAILAVRPGLPVILTTGYLHSEAQQDAQAAGIACVVTKPFEVRELISKVRMALKEPQPAAV